MATLFSSFALLLLVLVLDADTAAADAAAWLELLTLERQPVSSFFFVSIYFLPYSSPAPDANDRHGITINQQLAASSSSSSSSLLGHDITSCCIITWTPSTDSSSYSRWRLSLSLLNFISLLNTKKERERNLFFLPFFKIWNRHTNTHTVDTSGDVFFTRLYPEVPDLTVEAGNPLTKRKLVFFPVSSSSSFYYTIRNVWKPSQHLKGGLAQQSRQSVRD